VGVVRFLNASSDCGDLRIIKELHQWLLIPLRLREGCRLLDPFDDFSSVSNNIIHAQVGTIAVVRRWHDLGVEDEKHLNNFIVLSVLLRCFVLSHVSFNA
jgi:hypothetical protein